MKFATFLYQIGGPDLARVARRAEEVGFESLWIPEHLVLPVEYRSRYPYAATGRMPAPPDTPLHDPFLALAYAAAVTSRIRLATGIFVVPLRNAFATAKAVASLDVLSGGRLHLRCGYRMAGGGIRSGGDVVCRPRAAHSRVSRPDEPALDPQRADVRGPDGARRRREIHAQADPAAAPADRFAGIPSPRYAGPRNWRMDGTGSPRIFTTRAT